MRVQALILLLWLPAAILYVIHGTRHNDAAGASVVFSLGREMDLGTVSAGTHQLEFSVVNAGLTPIKVESVEATCTCTTLEFETGVLAVGERRPCRVSVSVKPKTRQVSVLTFKFGAPLSCSRTVLISATGKQGDVLTVLCSDDRETRVTPWTAERELRCTWRSTTDIGTTDTIWVQVEQSDGIHLGRVRELQRSSRTLECAVAVHVDTGRPYRATMQLHVMGGHPVRALQSLQLAFDVDVPAACEPQIVSLGSDCFREAVALPSIELRLAAGWYTKGAEFPPWLQCTIDNDQLQLAVVSPPPRTHGVETVLITCQDDTNRIFVASLKVVYETVPH